MIRGERIRAILEKGSAQKVVTCCGWARSVRVSKQVAFLVLNDGSSQDSLQVVVDSNHPAYAEVEHAGTGAAFRVTGELVASPAPEQPWELKATEIEVLGKSDPSYPLQKKRHGFEYLPNL